MQRCIPQIEVLGRSMTNGYRILLFMRNLISSRPCRMASLDNRASSYIKVRIRDEDCVILIMIILDGSLVCIFIISLKFGVFFSCK